MDTPPIRVLKHLSSTVCFFGLKPPAGEGYGCPACLLQKSLIRRHPARPCTPERGSPRTCKSYRTWHPCSSGSGPRQPSRRLCPGRCRVQGTAPEGAWWGRSALCADVLALVAAPAALHREVISLLLGDARSRGEEGRRIMELPARQARRVMNGCRFTHRILPHKLNWI